MKEAQVGVSQLGDDTCCLQQAIRTRSTASCEWRPYRLLLRNLRIVAMSGLSLLR